LSSSLNLAHKRLTEVIHHLVACIVFGAGSNDVAGEKFADREYWEEIVDQGFALVCPNYQIIKPLVILTARMAFDRHLDYKFAHIAPGPSSSSATPLHLAPKGIIC
jgi:hypothetical protein